jgi:hypothetical protein
MTHWQVARWLYRVSFVLLLLLTAGGVAILGLTFLHKGPGPPWWLALTWAAIMAIVWNIFGSLPYAINWEEGGVIEFHRFRGILRVHPLEVVSLSGTFLSAGYLRLKHRGGAVNLYAQMDGMHEFISRLKTANPAVRVTGC